MREIQAPGPSPRGRDYDTHPSWLMIGAYRGSISPPGANLFDSDIRHQHTVTIKIETAERKRDLNHDWIHGDKTLMEIEMSEAQWASFVSSMNTSGVPATLRFDSRADEPIVPGEPYAPRLALSMQETRDAGERVREDIRDAFYAYKEKKTVGNLRHLEAMIDNLPANLEYAATTLSKHAENVVTKARADIEAFVVRKAQQLGLEPGDLGESPLELGSGEDS